MEMTALHPISKVGRVGDVAVSGAAVDAFSVNPSAPGLWDFSR
jgi:hypothetical protein